VIRHPVAQKVHVMHDRESVMQTIRADLLGSVIHLLQIVHISVDSRQHVG